MLDFVFQEKDEGLTFTIVEKPADMMVTAEMVWSGYDGLIAECQG